MGRHLSLVQFKGIVILDWIDSMDRTRAKLDRIKESMLASGLYDRSDLYPDVFTKKSEVKADEVTSLPTATPNQDVKYELEAPTDFGESEYERLMAEIARNQNGSLSGDQVTRDGWI